MPINPPTHAVNAFSQAGSVFFDNYPLHKFMFAVVFNINPASGLSVRTERITLIVKTVQIGGWQIETDITNEYNRNRLTHTKIKYDDTNIVLHDVADGKAMRIAEKYYKYYFGDGRDYIGFGYDTSLIPGNNRRYIFDSIDIYQFQAKKANKTTLVNPKLISYKPDTADYSAIDGLMQMSFSFKPEYVKYERGISLPGSVLSELQKGGTPEHLAQVIDSSIITQHKEDQATLKNELLNTLEADTRVSMQKNAVDNFAGTAFTNESVDRLTTGSTVTRASTSSLDSFGRVVQDLRRKMPASTQKQTKKSYSLRADSVKSVDGSSEIVARDNTYNSQGGDT